MKLIMDTIVGADTGPLEMGRLAAYSPESSRDDRIVRSVQTMEKRDRTAAHCNRAGLESERPMSSGESG